jgi:hypothetical protein
MVERAGALSERKRAVDKRQGDKDRDQGKNTVIGHAGIQVRRAGRVVIVQRRDKVGD